MSKLELVLGGLALVGVGTVTGVAVPVVINQVYAAHPGYNFADLKEKVENEETFLAFIGLRSCPVCRRTYSDIRNDDTDLHAAIDKANKQTSLEHFVYYYYNRHSGQSREEFSSFWQELANYFDKKFADESNWTNWKSGINTAGEPAKYKNSISVPLAILFKNGQMTYIGQFTNPNSSTNSNQKKENNEQASSRDYSSLITKIKNAKNSD